MRDWSYALGYGALFAFVIYAAIMAGNAYVNGPRIAPACDPVTLWCGKLPR